MEAYIPGYCPQCGVAIMVRNSDKKFVSRKPNFAQADIHFANGQGVRTIICKTCLANPDYTKLIVAITNAGSTSTNAENKAIIINLGTPTGISERS